EYVRNGVPESRVHNFVYEAAKPQQKPKEGTHRNKRDADRSRWNLLFVGRMEQLKGGMILLNALPTIAARLGKPIRLVLAGDGPERATWEKRASRLRLQISSLKIEFTGWVDKSRLDTIYAQTDLLVVPSIWPEPFGRIGPEAGLRGIPVAAFNVGGIKDWLIDGVNGFLAPANPPTAVGLANAVVKCLHDPDIYPKLRTEAVAIASEFN